MLAGFPVKADLCQIGASIISEVFLDVVDNARGVSRVEGIVHNVIHDFSSGKNIPYGESKASAFLSRGFAFHLQGFVLNVGRRKDGSFFRLSNVGRFHGC